MTPEENRRKLRITTIVYWVLLIYIIAALLWWLFMLLKQNQESYFLQKEDTAIRYSGNASRMQEELARIEDLWRRNNTKYIGEGITFLVLILFGAVYVYRSVRRQFRLQQQQQNFMMAITHELKTPIAVSRLNLETLQRHRLDEEKKEKLLHMTLQETLRLDVLINNILVSSQLDENNYHRMREDISLSDLVLNAAAQFSSRYPERTLIKQVDEDIDMEGDPLLLKLLVSNLLENANKYSPREEPVHLILGREGKHIMLKVCDRGAGIAKEERAHVFKKFYRIGNEQTRASKGTGLGLYLCKKIAGEHGGSISIEDNVPNGSIFTVQFRS